MADRHGGRRHGDRRYSARPAHQAVRQPRHPKFFPDAKPNCAALDRISPAEGDYLNDKLHRADIAILDAAREAGVTGIDVSTALRVATALGNLDR
jgi:hypothetical protein